MRVSLKLGMFAAAATAAVIGAAVLGTTPLGAAQMPAPAAGVPQFRVDPTWPKDLPNQWIIQSVTGMFVDRDDNVWVLNTPRAISDNESDAEKNPPIAECCRRAPAVIKFSPQGDVLASWGGPGHAPGWPTSEHTIFTDSQGNVWIAGSQAGDTLMQFSPDGRLLRDFGKRGPKFEGPANTQPMNNQQTELLLRGVAAATLDEPANEIYVADGYLNKRVLVFDLRSGAFKRGWGAYGMPLAQISNANPPAHNPNGPPLRDYRPAVHCAQIARDGLVYVCDRGGNRIQVFNKQGQFQKEFIVANNTLNRGSAGSVSFSHDPEQRFLYMSDIQNAVVWILDRQSGQVVGRFGRRGYNAGQFMLLHIAVADSRGNMYTGEVAEAGRVQKFVPAR